MDWVKAFVTVRPIVGAIARHPRARNLMRDIALDQVAAKVMLGPRKRPDQSLLSITNPWSLDWSPAKAYLLARAAQFAYLMDLSGRRRFAARASLVPDHRKIPDLLMELCDFDVKGEHGYFHRLSVDRPAQALDVDGFVAANADLIIVSFSGTEPTDVVDLMTDLDAIPVPGPFERCLPRKGGRVRDGDVHKGFHDSLKALDEKDPWWVHVEALCAEKERPVYVTGHSLGGALALLASTNHFAKAKNKAARKLAGDRIRGVYTYGQAMIGDGALAMEAAPLFGDRVYRHVNGPDLGPRLAWFIDEYRHFGTRMAFRVTEDDLRAHWADWEWQGRVDAMLKLLPLCVTAHLPEAYVIGAWMSAPSPQPADAWEICQVKDECSPRLSGKCPLARPRDPARSPASTP
jgi:hypothetical protein